MDDLEPDLHVSEPRCPQCNGRLLLKDEIEPMCATGVKLDEWGCPQCMSGVYIDTAGKKEESDG